MARDWRCRLWLVAVILAVSTACSGSPSGSGSGETPAGQQTSSSPEQVAAVFDELVKGDITGGVYEDLRAVLVLVGVGRWWSATTTVPPKQRAMWLR